jgi:SAM-dependent methyltransferase
MAADNPFQPEHFAREDEASDEQFYSIPRIVAHIDDEAIGALSAFYSRTLKPDTEVLDLMSSCISHLPDDLALASVTGLGMNAVELEANPRLTERLVHDLNRDPRLPFEDARFDACLIAVSVQYMIHPIEVFAEIGRVLRPGAPCIVSFSNRCFWTKAVAVWRALNDEGHTKLVAMYFELSGRFETPDVDDLSPFPGRTDPIFAVTARRRAAISPP